MAGAAGNGAGSGCPLVIGLGWTGLGWTEYGRDLEKSFGKKTRYSYLLLDLAGMALVAYHRGENRGIITTSLGLNGLDTLEKKALIG
jgi:hypothetical protein